MDKLTDKIVITIIFITILIIFALIFSVKSPERKIIDSPIIWKEEYSNISIPKGFQNDLLVNRII